MSVPEPKFSKLKLDKATLALAEGEAEAIGTERCRGCGHLAVLHAGDEWDEWVTCGVDPCDCTDLER